MTQTRPFAELVALMEATHRPSPAEDKLDTITARMRETRDIKQDIEELEDRLKQAKKQYNELTHKILPDLMNEANQHFLRLPPEGNHPAFTFNLKDFYKANISNDDPKAPEAYQWLENHGEGDLIKRVITVELGRKSQSLQNEFLLFCKEKGIDPEIKLGVPWNTLTAWLKERHRQHLSQINSSEGEDPIEMPPLDMFGALIGQVAEMKEVKNR